MAKWLKQSTACTISLGPFIDDTDGKTAETALTVNQAAVRLRKNGGAAAQVNQSTTAPHDENGYYRKALDTTDTGTLGLLEVSAHISGSLPVWTDFIVVPAMIYDSLVAGSDRLDTNVTHVSDTAQTARDIGGAVPAVAAGASGGLIINGSNSGTVTLAALTISGAFTISDGLIISATTDGRAAISATGKTTGAALHLIAGASGNGMTIISGASGAGHGIDLQCGNATGSAFSMFSASECVVIESSASDALQLLAAARALATQGTIVLGGTLTVSDTVTFTKGLSASLIKVIATGPGGKTYTQDQALNTILGGVAGDTTINTSTGAFTIKDVDGTSRVVGIGLATGRTISAVTPGTS